ncbi:MAG TPA: transposase [Pirellulaceae bacterium]|nr:transposase [Pirellulaceae bacterium]
MAMDMWEPYVQATLESLPLAGEKIVFDRFHIMQHMTKAVDQVRKAENRPLSSEGDPLAGAAVAQATVKRLGRDAGEGAGGVDVTELCRPQNGAIETQGGY